MSVVLLLSSAVCGVFVGQAEDGPRSEPARPAVVSRPRPESSAVTAVAPEGIRHLIARLDAARFGGRQQATRALAAAGAPAVPFLVDALGDSSCEVRVRARLLLTQHESFAEVAAPLIAAFDKPYGPRARELLRDRAVAHVQETCQLPHVDKLFKLWGTSVDAYRERVRQQLTDAKTGAEAAQTVAPLLTLPAKAAHFSATLSRLEALSLACASQYDPGAVLMQTLARGLGAGQPAWVAFADRHLDALETLVAGLKRQNTPPHGIRRELSERANMSQGAAQFLVTLLDEKSPPSEILVKRLGVAPGALTEAFCRGLASLDSAACERGVGRVHIADMLTEEVRQWPELPADGVVQQLVTSTVRRIGDGDKPKALAFLDALEACRALSQHRLEPGAGVGKQLAERLYAAALEAPNIRAYSPTRRLHDKLAALADRGILAEHEAFPRRLLEAHLRGADEVTSDEQLLAAERYLRSLDRLQAAGLDLEQPGVKRFVVTLRDRLTTRHDVIAAGVLLLDQVLSPPRAAGQKLDPAAPDRALGQWVARVQAQ